MMSKPDAQSSLQVKTKLITSASRASPGIIISGSERNAAVIAFLYSVARSSSVSTFVIGNCAVPVISYSGGSSILIIFTLAFFQYKVVQECFSTLLIFLNRLVQR